MHIEEKNTPKGVYKEIMLLLSGDTTGFSEFPVGTWMLEPWACSFPGVPQELTFSSFLKTSSL